MTLLDFIAAWRDECGIGPTRTEIYINAPRWCGLTLRQVRSQLYQLRIAHRLGHAMVYYERKARMCYGGR